ncbi:MAG: hypothetical protein SGI74_12955 [Oligoflexia bacterium]|nr:hypothetical protein [Oligoflexia bacterium]
MSYTSDQLTALELAISQGALRVKYADKEVIYRSLDEMLRIRDLMRKDLGVIKSGEGNRFYMTTSKGTDG